ncbi:MAG: alpha/beta hydrolase [Chitinophagaceae bacterium]
MQGTNVSGILVENATINSDFLKRIVRVDYYYFQNTSYSTQINLLLINDGQDLSKMGFESIVEKLYAENDQMEPLLCVGIHCGPERKMEYGVAGSPDYKGFGAKASLYTSFVMQELLPLLNLKFGVSAIKRKAFAGFSLGGLTALDIVWKHPGEFNMAGVFSGSLWWRNIDQHAKEYDDDKHRIIHQQIRNGHFAPGLKFFFQCGNKDETKDRNQNGIIDSVEDTLDLVKELKKKGYRIGENIHYLELADGRHDFFTWGKVMPEFLKWGWMKKT